MKRNLSQLLMVLAIFTFAIISCKKEDPTPNPTPTYQTEEPIIALLNDTKYIVDTVKKATKVWQYGFEVEALKAGTIKEIGVLLPDTGNFEVKLYKLSNPNTALVSQKVSYVDAFKPTYISISNISLAAKEKIGIALVADVFFRVKNADKSNISYPIASSLGGLQVNSFSQDTIDMTVYPKTVVKDFFNPCVTFKYETTK